MVTFNPKVVKTLNLKTQDQNLAQRVIKIVENFTDKVVSYVNEHTGRTNIEKGLHSVGPYNIDVADLSESKHSIDKLMRDIQPKVKFENQTAEGIAKSVFQEIKNLNDQDIAEGQDSNLILGNKTGETYCDPGKKMGRQ